MLIIWSFAPLRKRKSGDQDAEGRRARRCIMEGRTFKTHRGAGAWKVVMMVWETKSEGLPWTMARKARPTDEHLLFSVSIGPRDMRTRIQPHTEGGGRLGGPGRYWWEGSRHSLRDLHVNEECCAAAVDGLLAVCHACGVSRRVVMCVWVLDSRR